MGLQIVDTTALSNFAHIKRVDLIRLALGGEGAITAIVREELHVGEKLGLVPVVDWGWLPIVRLSGDEEKLYDELTRLLDKGEASCLAVAINRKGMLISDDYAARRYAVRSGVLVMGTLGLLRVLITLNHLTQPEADQLLSAMIREGYRSPVRSLGEIKD